MGFTPGTVPTRSLDWALLVAGVEVASRWTRSELAELRRELDPDDRSASSVEHRWKTIGTETPSPRDRRKETG